LTRWWKASFLLNSDPIAPFLAIWLVPSEKELHALVLIEDGFHGVREDVWSVEAVHPRPDLRWGTLKGPVGKRQRHEKCIFRAVGERLHFA